MTSKKRPVKLSLRIHVSQEDSSSDEPVDIYYRGKIPLYIVDKIIEVLFSKWEE
jgi:hypothetical protein